MSPSSELSPAPRARLEALNPKRAWKSWADTVARASVYVRACAAATATAADKPPQPREQDRVSWDTPELGVAQGWLK